MFSPEYIHVDKICSSNGRDCETDKNKTECKAAIGPKRSSSAKGKIRLHLNKSVGCETMWPKWLGSFERNELQDRYDPDGALDRDRAKQMFCWKRPEKVQSTSHASKNIWYQILWSGHSEGL